MPIFTVTARRFTSEDFIVGNWHLSHERKQLIIIFEIFNPITRKPTNHRKTKPNMDDPQNPLTQESMTLRDYFAAAALTGMLSHIQAIPQKCVDISFEIADAMLKAREQ